MNTFTTSHQAEQGWTSPLPIALDSPQTLVLAFAAPEFGTYLRPWQQLGAAFPQAIPAACSTAGEIAGREPYDATISVAVVRFESSVLRRTWTVVANAQDSLAAGERLARQPAGLMDGKDLNAVFVLSGALSVHGTLIFEGLSGPLPPGAAVGSGPADDGSSFAETWVFDSGRPQFQDVCAVGCCGPGLRVGQGSAGGWSGFGPDRLVTRSEGNVLYQWDGKPALELYKSCPGERAAGLPGTALPLPLATRRAGHGNETLVRTILGVDDAQQSLTLAGDLPQGAVAWLMRANTDHASKSASSAARAATEGAGGADQALVISVSCVGRRRVLGQRAEEEVEMDCNGTAGHAAPIGFCAYGEIARGLPGGAGDLHRQTMTVNVIEAC